MLDELDSKLAALSRAERRVASWVLAHPRRAIGATIADVAAAAGASEPTVVRFCRRVGASGFREFKMRLAQALSRPASIAHKHVLVDDGVDEAAGKVLDQSILALHELRGRLSELPFEAATERLAATRQIIFAGLGSSGQVAGDAHQKFFRLGVPCSVALDTPTLLQTAAIVGGDDTLVIISVEGAWPATVKAAENARSRGATVIAFTDPASPLAAAADIMFAFQASDDSSVYTPMSSRMVHLAVLDALQVTLALRLGSVAEERLRASKSALLGA